MSKLHQDIIEKYHHYTMVFTVVELNTNHYIFRAVIADHIASKIGTNTQNIDHLVNYKTILSGTAFPIGSYDLQKNVLIWADTSFTLDKIIVKEIRKIRLDLSNKIKSNKAKVMSQDFSVITRYELDEMLLKMSKLLNKEILIDDDGKSLHIFLVQKILSDER